MFIKEEFAHKIRLRPFMAAIPACTDLKKLDAKIEELAGKPCGERDLAECAKAFRINPYSFGHMVQAREKRS